MALNAKSFALTGGILWGLCMLITTILSVTTGYGTALLELMGSLYPGYSISWLGSIIGLVYGFIDGFIGLYIFAWLYNKLNKEQVQA